MRSSVAACWRSARVAARLAAPRARPPTQAQAIASATSRRPRRGASTSSARCGRRAGVPRSCRRCSTTTSRSRRGPGAVIVEDDKATDAATGEALELPAARRRRGRGQQQPHARRDSRRRSPRCKLVLARTRRCAPQAVARAARQRRRSAAAADREGAAQRDRRRAQGAARAAARRDADARQRRRGQAPRRGQGAGRRAASRRRAALLLERAGPATRPTPRCAAALAASRSTRSRRAWPGASALGVAVHRRQPRLDPAAGRARPRDHLRPDGRHQHGARRADDDRRLRHLRRAEPVPRSTCPARSTGTCCAAIPVAFLVGGAGRHGARAHA